MRPDRLRLEHGPRLLGVTERAPRLSWWLPGRATRQEAYRIECGGWDSGRVESPTFAYVAYRGPALSSRQIVDWRVKVWTDLGESEWSEPASWEMGLLETSDWQARFIGPLERETLEPGHRPAYVLRRTFELASAAAAGRAYATAHGIYELFLDGRRIGDLELTPGFTAYRAHLEVQTFDVTEHLTAGTHTLDAVLSDGWYRGQTGFHRNYDCFGSRTAVLVQLEATAPDGTRTTVGTDEQWSCSTGPITAADLMEGQREDHRIHPDDWVPVDVLDEDVARLTSSPAPPVRRIEEIAPRRISELAPRRHLVDLGQNINGWVRSANLGPTGSRIRFVHGERLHADGTLDVDHLRPLEIVDGEQRSAGQVDEVIANGEPGEIFEPRHTTHGFQYVEVDGPSTLAPDDVRGIVVHTDLARTGWFSCSDDRINALHEAAVWSFRGNACDVPTDCPHRERAGWTGDWQLFAPTAAFLYDVAGFSRRWLRDLAADQWPDGRVPNFVPEPRGPAAWKDLTADYLTGAAGWGDAAVLVPWAMWLEYGDERFLRSSYRSAVRWLEYAEGKARTGRHRSRVDARPTPLPHEERLWDSGFHWGEWCEPGGNPAGVFTQELDVGDVATAYLHLSASVLASTASVLGEDGDHDRWTELAAGSRRAWQAEFIDADGEIQPATQANLVRALAFGLVPDDVRAQAADRLVELILSADTHLGTGFLATPYLLPVLADTGHVDVAYELLFQDTAPSWLAMIDAGATTVWENWEGLDENGTGSFNHYSKGAVVSFLHRYTAGIRPDATVPAYERFEIKPVPGGGITSASAVHDSIRGRVESSWALEGSVFSLDVEVPPGGTATVTLPDGAEHVVAPGRFHFDTTMPERGRS